MAIEELVAVVPPPAKPLESGPPERWIRSEEELGVRLPQDYRDFSTTYGTGRFCGGFIEVFNPFSEHYVEIIHSQIHLLNSIREGGMEVPYEIFPSSAGLLPWGRNENGHMMCWITKGKAEKWPVILRRHENVYEMWKMPITTFLAKAFRGDIDPIVWSRFGPEELIFESFIPKYKKKGKKPKDH